jgi:hypothetical protein
VHKKLHLKKPEVPGMSQTCVVHPSRVTFFIAGIFVGTFQNVFEKHQSTQQLRPYIRFPSPLHIEALKTGKKNPLTVWCCGFFLVL